MGINEEMMDTFGGGQVTWHKVHKKRRHYGPKIYVKSLAIFFALSCISILPIFNLINEAASTSINLFYFQGKSILFLISCVLILLSGLGLYKKGLRYGGYSLGIFATSILFELTNPTYQPSVAFFGIIILLIIILTTKKK